jgi:hypothetical protein
LRLPHTLVTISDYFMKFVHPLKRLVFDPWIRVLPFACFSGYAKFEDLIIDST